MGGEGREVGGVLLCEGRGLQRLGKTANAKGDGTRRLYSQASMNLDMDRYRGFGEGRVAPASSDLYLLLLSTQWAGLEAGVWNRVSSR